MTIVFKVNYGPDIATAEEAIRIAEQNVSAQVVKFVLEPNMPRCLPEFVHRSISLWSFDSNRDKKWLEHYIYDGYGNPLEEGKPN